MTRTLLAPFAACLLCAGAAQAQPKPEGAAQPKPEKEKAPASQAEIDRQIQEAVQKEVAKVKEQLRDEVRAEIQGAQSAAAFMGRAEERPKLELLELNGYLRFRADLFNNMNLNQAKSNWTNFPSPLLGPNGTQTTANLRFRFDPTFNVSEEVRVRATVDILDNLVMGSSPQVAPYNDLAFTTFSQLSPSNAVAAKRAWGEVQTPIGLLSFGRMPSQWGLGILASAGNGVDDDRGDSVDRIQFAIPIGTPLGLTVIPQYDFAAAGLTSESLAAYRGVLGQPIAVEQSTGVGSLGVKIVHQDSPDEIRRRLEKGLSSFNGGLYFTYRTERIALFTDSQGNVVDGQGNLLVPALKRDAYSLTFDLWAGYESRRLKLEAELVGVYGNIANAATQLVQDPNSPGDPTKKVPESGLENVLIRQAAGALRGQYKLAEGKLLLGAEAGAASGDRNPGFGYFTGRNPYPQAGAFDGRQYSASDGVVDLRNYRFNPAYRVDLVLWRNLIGGVTDAWYVKPTLRWEFLPGVVGTAQVVYSQAFYAESTPSTVHKPLGVEADLGLSYTSDDGFVAFLEYGLLFPLDGMRGKPGSTDNSGNPLDGDMTKANYIHTGLAVKF
jgi:uncharacterized protein (TIGR04551 family)